MPRVSLNRRSLDSIETDFDVFDPSRVAKEEPREPRLMAQGSKRRPIAVAGMAATAALMTIVVLTGSAH